MRMVFIIIETKQEIKPHRHVIIDILSKTYQIHKIDDFLTRLVIYVEPGVIHDSDIFYGLAEELYADVRVYISANEPKFMIEAVDTWFKMIPFNQTIVYDDHMILLKRLDYPITKDLRKIILKTVSDDNELLNTVKMYLETDQNTSKASQKLYLHRNTLIQRLDKFFNRTGFDCRNFVDAFIIYMLIK